jgi:hypothetical protein
VPRLRAYLAHTLTYTSRLSAKRADRPPSHDALRTLVRNMAAIAPDAVAALTTDVAKSLHSAAETDAVIAADVLALLLSRDAAHNRGEEVRVIQQVLSAAQGTTPALRLKLVHLLPSIAEQCASDAERKRCHTALEARLKDGDASVRAAAVRSVGEVALEATDARRAAALTKLLERLRDVSEAVRSMVRLSLPRSHCLDESLQRLNMSAWAWLRADFEALCMAAQMTIIGCCRR